MTPLLEIGEMVLTDTKTGKDFFFRPSLLAMTRIGAPSEIVRTHALLVGFDISNLLHRAQMALGTVHPLVVNEAIRRGNTEVVYHVIANTTHSLHVTQSAMTSTLALLTIRSGRRAALLMPLLMNG